MNISYFVCLGVEVLYLLSIILFPINFDVLNTGFIELVPLSHQDNAIRRPFFLKLNLNLTKFKR